MPKSLVVSERGCLTRTELFANVAAWVGELGPERARPRSTPTVTLLRERRGLCLWGG
jgi:hypothetical protein